MHGFQIDPDVPVGCRTENGEIKGMSLLILSTVHAVKRLIQTPEHWVFRSVNPDYKDIRVPKAECAYPILGVMMGRLA